MQVADVAGGKVGKSQSLDVFLQQAQNAKVWIAAAAVIVCALLRHAFNLIVFSVAVSALVLAVLACLQSMGVFRVPHIGLYLSRMPIESSITLLGIIIAVLTAAGAWRRQKRDELLLSSLNEIQAFFEIALHIAIEINSYTLLLKELQIEAKAGPHALTSLWRAQHLSDYATEIQNKKKRLGEFGTVIHVLDSRNIHALASNPVVFRSFKASKAAVLGLAHSSHFNVPNPAADPYDFISNLRLLPDEEFDTYLMSFGQLNEQAGGGLGGLRGAIQAKFFPPTLTLAWALLRMKNDP